MNHIYRVIYNHSANCWQAVSEIGRSKHKTRSEKNAVTAENNDYNPACLPACLAIIVSAILHSPAYAAPQGGQVSAGQATISQQQLTTDIHQSSQNAVINWQKFDIQPNETVNFHQPNAESITLNRVVGNEESAIRGAINANGNVFISNPNGVLIGKEAQINVGSLVATTQNIKDDDLMNNRLNFNGQAGGKVENNANIKVPKGGVIALIAPIVKNSGKLTASEGAVLLASAEQFRITLPKDNFSYTLDRGTLQGLVDNQGAILADGGRVVLTAKGIDTVKKSVIKHSGAIEANTVSNKNGVVELLGDLDNSELQMTGSIKAEGKGTQQGGQIETSAAKLKISEKAHVSTKSEKGKTGKWTIDPKDFTVAKSGGDMSGQAVSNALKNNNVELKSRNGAKEGKGDVIINDEISWDKNTLTLNAENDIHINKTLNGTGTAKLSLKIGYKHFETVNDVVGKLYFEKHLPILERTAKINLPEGDNLIIHQGLESGKHHVTKFKVIHDMPEITLELGKYRSRFEDSNIALGRDIDLSYVGNYKGFLGWSLKSYSNIEGLGHNLSNLTLHNDTDYQNVGMFDLSNSQSSIFSNLIIKDIDIYTKGDRVNVGGLSGRFRDNAHIGNVGVLGKIVSEGKYTSVGGVLGRTEPSSFYMGSSQDHIRKTIENVESNIDISVSGKNGNVGTNNNIGGVIGLQSSSGFSVKNVYSNGNIHLKSDESNVGGVLGIQKSNGVISNSSFNGKIYSQGHRNVIGGLVGDDIFGKGVSNSYVTGNISSEGISAVIGGLIGKSSDEKSAISNTYSIGDMIIDGKGSVAGGLVGIKLSNAEIVNSYAVKTMKKINQDTKLGGLIGRSSGGGDKMTNSYYNIDNINGDNFGIAKSLLDLKAQFTFENWDFDTIWRIDEGRDYPRLRALTESKIVVTPDPEKTEAGITANNLSKTYDGEAVKTEADLAKLDGWNGTGYTVSGLKEGDSVASIFNGGLTFNGARSTWKGAVNAGEYVLDPTADLTETAKQKYEIVWNTGKLTINKRPVSLIGTKTYNGTPFVRATDFTRVNGLVDKDKSLAYGTDDKLLADTLSGTATAEGKDARDEFYRLKEVSGLSLKEALAKNYEINPANSLVQITPRILNLEISKTYDGSSIFDNGFNLGNGLSVNSTTLTATNVLDNDKVNLSSRGLSVNGVNAGIYERLKSGVIESDNPNYIYTASQSQVKAEIKPKTIALEGHKEYDGTRDVTTKQITKLNGVVNKSDELVLLQHIQGSGTLNSENVMEGKTLVNSDFKFAKDLISAPDAVSNYVISPLLSRWNITPRAVIVNGEREYDGTNLVQAGKSKFTFSNLANKEKQNSSLLTIASGVGRINGVDVNSSGYVLSNKFSLKLGGSSASNYYIADSVSPEFKDVVDKGNGWKVLPRVLHISVEKTEDGNRKFTRNIELTNIATKDNQMDDVKVSGVISARDANVGKKEKFDVSESRLILSGTDAKNYVLPPFHIDYIDAVIQPAKKDDKLERDEDSNGEPKQIGLSDLVKIKDQDKLSTELNISQREIIGTLLNVPKQWEENLGVFGKDGVHFINGSARFSDIHQLGNNTEVAEFVMNFRQVPDQATEFSEQVVADLPEVKFIDGNLVDDLLGNSDMTIGDTIKNIVRTNYLVKKFNESDQYDKKLGEFYSLYLSDNKELERKIRVNLDNANVLINEANNPRGLSGEELWARSWRNSAGLMMDGASGALIASKYFMPTGKLENLKEKFSSLEKLKEMVTASSDEYKRYLDVASVFMDKIPILYQTFTEIASNNGAIEDKHLGVMIDTIDGLLKASQKLKSKNFALEAEGVGFMGDLAVTLSKISDSAQTIKNSREFIRKMNAIPDELLSEGDKKVFEALLSNKQLFSALDSVLSVGKLIPPLKSLVEPIDDIKSILQTFLKTTNERTVNSRYEIINSKAENMQNSIENAVIIRSGMMRDTLIQAGKIGVKNN